MANRRKGKPPKVVDFMPDWDAQAKEKQSPDQMLAIAEAINKRMGGKDLRGKRGDSRKPTN